MSWLCCVTQDRFLPLSEAQCPLWEEREPVQQAGVLPTLVALAFVPWPCCLQQRQESA
jgi:hypothetical protein